jgi:beta-glucosidase
VFVNLSGSAVAMPWADEHLNAILQAWYPGQAGGTAVADVLTGAYNPAGRLPVTFYRSTDDLPPFEDYDMVGRTYRYFEGDPLYPFGHGLSYTTFAYENLRTSASTLEAPITVSVDVTNTGEVMGNEVVQLYVAFPAAAGERPIKDLRGFRRITLAPGETQTVTFPLTARDVAYWNAEADAWAVEPGPVQLQVGASSSDIRLTTTVSSGL